MILYSSRKLGYRKVHSSPQVFLQRLEEKKKSNWSVVIPKTPPVKRKLRRRCYMESIADCRELVGV
jgi:hypothetical protein